MGSRSLRASTARRSARPARLADLVEAAQAAERAGAWDQSLAYYEQAFGRLTREGDAARAAELLRWIATVHRERGDLELAGELCEASLAVAEASGAREHVAAALNCLATVELLAGRVEVAESLYCRARALADELGDARLGAMVEQNLGTLANIRGDVGGALSAYTSALERYRRLGDLRGAAWALNNMGMAHVDLGEWELAEACYDEAFSLGDRLHDTALLGLLELNRAELHLRRGRFDRARESCDRAFEIHSRLRSQAGLGEANKLYGILYRETSKPALADVHLSQAIALAQRCQDRLLEAEALSEYALVHLAEQRNREALECLNRAHALFRELGARRELLDLERRLDRLEETYLRVVQAWGESIESKDRYTAGHCQRVADYATMLAAAIGFQGRDLTWLRMGAFLHDVGKMAVPPEVLNKPGALTAEEWELMRQHPVVGDEIVAEMKFPWDIRPIVRNHHERWDGGGYPDGLRGEEIPLTARILCVADVFDALTTARSYRPAMGREEALAIMERDAGKIFDPHLFRIFRTLVEAAPTRGPRRPREVQLIGV